MRNPGAPGTRDTNLLALFFFSLYLFVSQSKEYPLKHKHTRLLLAEPQDKAHQCTGVGSTPVE